jgi:hypothetical protein
MLKTKSFCLCDHFHAAPVPKQHEAEKLIRKWVRVKLDERHSIDFVVKIDCMPFSIIFIFGSTGV